jgi:hypothetical protein
MPVAEVLKSCDPREIKTALISLLDETTPEDIRLLDKEFREAHNKYTFLAEFETSISEAAHRSPILLARYAHYCWIRLEISYLCNQKAQLNYVSAMKSVLKEPLATTPSIERPSIPRLDSISSAIQKDRASGVSIEESIRTLKKINLQIVGTEHPTDPLSQEARNIITNIAKAMAETPTNDILLTTLLHHLSLCDPIPPTRRSIVEEVNRNIGTTLANLYDNVPALVDEILGAYQTHYGEDLFKLHKEGILAAIEGRQYPDALNSPPLMRPASWPSFDRDGNKKATAMGMRNGIQDLRIGIATKHINTIESCIACHAKETEKSLRESLFDYADQLIPPAQQIPEDDIQLTLLKIQNQAARFISNRNFDELLAHYERALAYTRLLTIDAEVKEHLIVILEQQIQISRSMAALTKFSGFYREGDLNLSGDLQRFQKLFETYKAAIEKDTDAIEMKSREGKSIPASQLILEEYHHLIEKHDATLQMFPELLKKVRYFGIQLHCFGMTYGAGHVRQDSSIFVTVWDALFAYIITHKEFAKYDFFAPLYVNVYSHLQEEERISLHKKLQDGSPESNEILQTIYTKYTTGAFSTNPQYQKIPDFYWVNSELDCLQLTLRHHDMFETFIISNTKSAANLLEVESLLAIFPKKLRRSPPTIVPLLETRQDIAAHERILTDYIKTKSHQTLELGLTSSAPLSTKTVIEIMLGFSDTERVSGLSALVAIQKVQEDFFKLAVHLGVTPKIYYGPGGDINRGGLKTRFEKATLQGNARSNLLNTEESILWYLENLFHQAYQSHTNPSSIMEISLLAPNLRALLEKAMDEGAAFYERLRENEQGFGKLMGCLFGHGPQWIVTMLNSSSRATQRDMIDNPVDRTSSVQSNGIRPERFVHIDKLRAITAAQMQEMLSDNLDLIGACKGLRAIGIEACDELLDNSKTFRDMVAKECFGVATRNLSFSAYALFGEDPLYYPQDKSQQLLWAKECEDYPQMLQDKDFDIEAMSMNPAEKPKLLTMLSRLFAYIAVECDNTERFLIELLKRRHPMKKDTTKSRGQSVSLLSGYPLWQQQTEEVIHEVEPLSYILARLTHLVNNDGNLDAIYPELRDEEAPDSRLSGIGRFVGAVGAGITAARIMQPGFTESLFTDLRENTKRQGVINAASETAAIEGALQLSRAEHLSFFSLPADVRKEFERTIIARHHVHTPSKL